MTMATLGCRVLAAGAAVLLVVAVAALPGRTAEESQPSDREAIAALLAGSIEAGYREEDVAKFISPYLPDAQIGTYIWGLVDPPTYGARTAEDFAALSNQEVRVQILELTVAGDEARATIDLGVRGERSGGGKVNRHDRYYLLLQRTPSGWRISRQGYRPDFTVAPLLMHGR